MRAFTAATATLVCGFLFSSAVSASANEPRQLSGIYPHLAMFNNEAECGTGAVVPWADRLWVVTYASHAPEGSSDKLYEITPALEQIIRPESIGGTPANRMIHRESNQLFIGPYAIDAERRVRAIPYARMFGRPTGNARHLFDPANKIYAASMEEALYEIDTRTLEVTELWADEAKKEGRHAGLPGYHGKGLYSGQGVIVYANNGDRGATAMSHPATPSGVLAEWDGKSDAWKIIRRQQFTEVTGPGGLTGNPQPDTDPIWSIGWDHRSLILMVREPGKGWSSFRLPKSSHSYDGAHGWNTEWPRIRDIGEDTLLMTMHGAFWSFPKTFSATNSAGLAPRSNYLKVIGDFTRWQDRIVFGCDDTAKNEFLNTRRAKGTLAPPQSQSNLWFVEPAHLDRLGPVIGRGAVWEQDDVAAATPSEPFLIAGYDHRGLHLSHTTTQPATLTLEIDATGNGQWTTARTVSLAPGETTWLDLGELRATWLRLRSDRPLTGATAWFSFRNHDARPTESDALFAGLATVADTAVTGGLIRARGENKRTLSFAAQTAAGETLGYYELDGALALRRVEDAEALAYTRQHTAIPTGVLTTDAASVLFIDDAGRRWRLPKGDPAFDRDGPLGPARVCREVATERDLFHAHGTFYELPAENAGGFAKLRPVATHGFRVHDFCSYRGLFVVSGLRADAPADNPHVIRSDDGRTALWAGALDDLWKLGKPRGQGGPWKDTSVAAGENSDPYLLTAYDRKTLTLSHQSATPVALTVEIDLTGAGLWKPYRTFTVPSGEAVTHEFPRAFSAYWLRVRSDTATTATAWLVYE